MAGYFLRLAEAVLSPAPGLRPLAAATASPSPLVVEDEAMALPAPDLANGMAPASAGPKPAPDPRDASEPGSELRVAPVAEPSHAVRSREEASRPTTTAPARSAPIPLSAKEADPSMRTAPSAIPLGHGDTPEPAPFTAAPPLKALARTPAADSQRPRQAATDPRPVRARPAREPRADRAPVAAAPEVHIHIGRIELTAVAPPKQERKETASARKPLSLDEYLRHRDGRSS